jgi:hypothetical protein
MQRYTVFPDGELKPDVDGQWVAYDEVEHVLEIIRGRVAAKLAWPWPDMRDTLDALEAGHEHT